MEVLLEHLTLYLFSEIDGGNSVLLGAIIIIGALYVDINYKLQIINFEIVSIYFLRCFSSTGTRKAIMCRSFYYTLTLYCSFMLNWKSVLKACTHFC